MSGGSFDYLCFKDVSELFQRVGQVESMAKAIGEYPDGEAASIDAHEVVAIMKTALRRLEARRRRLEPVWMAVEWHHSCDYGPERVAEALRVYYDGKGSC